MDEKKKVSNPYEQTMHRYVFAGEATGVCNKCGVSFNDHFHTKEFLAKVLASIDKRIWKYTSYAQRLRYIDEAKLWKTEQRKRLEVQ